VVPGAGNPHWPGGAHPPRGVNAPQILMLSKFSSTISLANWQTRLGDVYNSVSRKC